MNISDYISLSIGLIYIIPVILYIQSGAWINIKAFIGIIGTTIISESLKYFFIGNISPRPKGAKDCDLLCKNGNQEGKPGMPSSHSAEVAFFSVFYFQQTTNPIIQIILIIYSGIMMLSRYVKRCHTINQIVVGAVLGTSLSLIIVRHL